MRHAAWTRSTAWGLGHLSCDPRLHELAQRVVGRNLVKPKRPGALYAQGRARVCQHRAVWLQFAGSAARTSPPG